MTKKTAAAAAKAVRGVKSKTKPKSKPRPKPHPAHSTRGKLPVRGAEQKAGKTLTGLAAMAGLGQEEEDEDTGVETAEVVEVVEDVAEETEPDPLAALPAERPRAKAGRPPGEPYEKITVVLSLSAVVKLDRFLVDLREKGVVASRASVIRELVLGVDLADMARQTWNVDLEES